MWPWRTFPYIITGTIGSVLMGQGFSLLGELWSFVGGFSPQWHSLWTVYYVHTNFCLYLKGNNQCFLSLFFYNIHKMSSAMSGTQIIELTIELTFFFLKECGWMVNLICVSPVRLTGGWGVVKWPGLTLRVNLESWVWPTALGLFSCNF